MPFPQSMVHDGGAFQPLSFSTSEFHFIVLSSDAVQIVSSLNGDLVEEERLMATDGTPLGMVGDMVRVAHLLYTSHCIYQVGGGRPCVVGGGGSERRRRLTLCGCVVCVLCVVRARVGDAGERRPQRLAHVSGQGGGVGRRDDVRHGDAVREDAGKRRCVGPSCQATSSVMSVWACACVAGDVCRIKSDSSIARARSSTTRRVVWTRRRGTSRSRVCSSRT